MSAAACDPHTPLLVTGAGGFLGRHLLAAEPACRRLSLRAGDAVADKLADALAGRPAAAVVHLGGRAHRGDAQAPEALERYRRDNVALTRALAEAALDHGIRRFVFLSSIGVLGRGSGARPFTAATPPAPWSPYARSKLEAEQALWELARSRGLEPVILRPPLIYGAGAPGNLARLARALERGLPLPLAAVRNRRSLVNAADLAELLSLVARHPDAPGRVLLPADAEPVSTPELIRALATALGRPARLLPLPVSLLRLAGRLTGRAGSVAQLVGNLEIDPAERDRCLGWRPQRGLRAGLAAFAESRRAA